MPKFLINSIFVWIFYCSKTGDEMDYSSAKWKKKRAYILRIDGYKDVVAGWYGRTVEAKMVHHIYPAEDYPEYAWEDWNLISVSYSTHKKLENHMTGGLTEMGRQLMRSTVPGVDWRKGRKVSPLRL